MDADILPFLLNPAETASGWCSVLVTMTKNLEKIA